MRTKEKIKQYIKDNRLEVLDKSSKGTYDGSGYYQAVNLQYIWEYLLNKKVSIKFVAKKIAELCAEEYLLPIPCDFANNLVFCNYNWSIGKYFDKFHFDKDENKIVIRDYYYKNSKFENYVNNFNEYLK